MHNTIRLQTSGSANQKFLTDRMLLTYVLLAFICVVISVLRQGEQERHRIVVDCCCTDRTQPHSRVVPAPRVAAHAHPPQRRYAPTERDIHARSQTLPRHPFPPNYPTPGLHWHSPETSPDLASVEQSASRVGGRGCSVRRVWWHA